MSKIAKNKLCVFTAHWNDDKLIDIGNDPSFDGIPTWGICRPNIRKSVTIGSRILFIGRVNTQYFVKGWMEVGEKISYVEALSRFPNNENVILSKEKTDREKEELDYYCEQFKSPNVDFLTQINSKEGIFYQNSRDKHGIDNWKCRRIFHCNKIKFQECAAKGNCALDSISIELDSYKNYIVAHPQKWGECGSLRIEYEEIKELTGIKHPPEIKYPLKTPMNQHNPFNVSVEAMDKVIAYLSNRVNQGL